MLSIFFPKYLAAILDYDVKKTGESRNSALEGGYQVEKGRRKKIWKSKMAAQCTNDC